MRLVSQTIEIFPLRPVPPYIADTGQVFRTLTAVSHLKVLGLDPYMLIKILLVERVPVLIIFALGD